MKYNQNFTNYEIVFDELREFKSRNERISDIVIEDDKLYVCENYYLTEKQDIVWILIVLFIQNLFTYIVDLSCDTLWLKGASYY